ncbi:MAG: nuclear transport factor 2 family protein [Verrucomicrobiota bacterium]
MDRSQIEQALNCLYESRLDNDTNRCACCFAEDANISIAGTESVNTKLGQASIRDVVDQLITIWHWEKRENIHVIVDGLNVAARYDLTVVYTPTNDRFTTQIMDHIEFDENLKIKHITEFVDTALIAKLTASA